MPDLLIKEAELKQLEVVLQEQIPPKYGGIFVNFLNAVAQQRAREQQASTANKEIIAASPTAEASLNGQEKGPSPTEEARDNK